MENLVGKTLSKYRVVAKLGSGGMAEVYKAYQPGLDRYVAIKVMYEHLSADADLVKRFRREALAMGRLSHSNIVQVLDFDQEAGLSFMVMQFVNGPTLKDEVKARRAVGRQFGLEEVARIYQTLGGAIDYAHKHDMVHRDLKPANIMINEEGQVLLTDFGIARLVHGTQYTATGALMGTPAYMSPEQGQGAKVDGRSDIYTFGVILYELVTGKVPFDAPTPVGVMMKHILEPLPPPTSLNPQLPREVEQVILKATRKAPEERYQTAGEMAQALYEAVGLSAGDTLRHQRLKVSAKPPNITSELNPHQDHFTPVGLTSPATTPKIQTGPLTSTAPQVAAPVPSSRQSSLLLLAGGIGLVVALLLIGAGILLWPGDSSAPTPTAAAAIVPTETPQPPPAQPDTAATATAAWQSGDDDRDGLANAEEIAAGTLPDSRDSDQDGIDDLEEINQFETNPLDADTDGDSLADGAEVSQGLSPLAGDTDGDGMFDASDPDPSNPPTPTSPAATDTPTPEPTVTAVPTEEPSVTPTAGAASSVAPAAGPAAPGVFEDFEGQSAWRRGDQANGTFERSAAQTHNGSYAGQLDYNFPSANNDFVVFLRNRSLAGRPSALTAWVYGDGAGHFLNVWIKDNGGQVWGMSFGQISHTGWQQMTAYLDPNQPWPSGHISGDDNGAIDYPISFQALTLDDGNDGFSGQGTIYIDDLSSQEGATAPPPTPTTTLAGAVATPPPAAKTPAAANANFQLKRGQEFNYVQPWGSPRNGDICQALKYHEWDDTQGIYRSLTVELLLTNNSSRPVPDDWGGVAYVTGYGEQGTFCHYEYPGSGPPPGENRSVTFFALVPIGDYIQYIRLDPPEGAPLELCLNRDGSACQ